VKENENPVFDSIQLPFSFVFLFMAVLFGLTL